MDRGENEAGLYQHAMPDRPGPDGCGQAHFGSVGKIGDTYSISLNLFDTQNARAENALSEFCRSENDLISVLQQAVRKLLAGR